MREYRDELKMLGEALRYVLERQATADEESEGFVPIGRYGDEPTGTRVYAVLEEAGLVKLMRVLRGAEIIGAQITESGRAMLRDH